MERASSFYEFIPDIFILIALGALAFFLLLRHFTLVSLAAGGEFEKLSRLRVSNLSVAVFLLSICLVYLFLRLLVFSSHFNPVGYAAVGAFAIFGFAIFFNAGVMYLGLRQIIKRRNER